MDHAEAIRSGATERYLLGELTDDERHAYEEHFFDCLDCAEDVKAGAAFVGNAREVLKTEPPERAEAAFARPRRPGWRALFFPMPAGLAAALVLVVSLVAYQSLVVLPGLRHQVAEAEAPQAVSSAFLSIARSETQVVTVSPHDRKVELRLSRNTDRSYPHYRLEVQDATGTVVQRGVVAAPPPGEELQVLLSVSQLPPGAYVIALAGLDSPGGPVAAPDFARYPFTLQRREE